MIPSRRRSAASWPVPFRTAWTLLALLASQWVATAAGPYRIPTPAATATSRSLQTALDRYVATPDPTFAWKAVGTASKDGVSVTSIDLTSQTWLTPSEVNRPVWKHWLTVVRPPNVASDTALLFISGGSNRDQDPPKPGKELGMIALATRSVVVELKMVPNQTLIFDNDGRERVEDDLIAYTWDKYLRTGDERWPARLPMTKAAVRAMDAVEAWTGTAEGGGKSIRRFVVAGGSKRGWTTWTTAIVDNRVVAIAPIVIDCLNLEASMLHHYRAYGFYAPAVGNYTEQGIMNWLGTPEMTALRKIEDPFEYRDRLTLPKLIMNAGGDQFFLPDSSQFYFDQLPGVKYLRYVPNADHSLRGSDAYETLGAWQFATANRVTLPRFSWKTEANGTLRVTAADAPKAVKFWQINNPTARDFRLEVVGPAWWSRPLTDEGGGVYQGRPSEAKGYTAYLIELTYDIGAPVPLKLTTQVKVTPDTLPHAAPNPVRPKGFLQK
jgi:PhoPQ-activated pathogenicity-related protein